jgi:N-acetylglucosamine kinase-like BadF-type ATPase
VRPVLGADGGGSKTHALVADERGEVLGFASSGRSNWEDTGLEAAGAALAEAVGGALAAAQVPPGGLAAGAFGLAGLDWGPDRPMLAALPAPSPWPDVRGLRQRHRRGRRGSGPWPTPGPAAGRPPP